MEKALRFKINLTTKDLWQFSMYHANGGMMGMVNLLFTLAALFLIITRWNSVTTPYRLLLIVCVLLFTVWQPLLLYYKAHKQAKVSEIRETMLLTFDETGIHVEQNGQMVELAWDQVGRIDKMPTMVIVYMDRIHAYLLPKQTIGNQGEVFYEMVRTHLPKERRRRI